MVQARKPKGSPGSSGGQFTTSHADSPTPPTFNTLTERQHASVVMAKRLIVDSIWKNANIETNVTFPQSQMIYENLEAQGLRPSQIIIVNNVKHAWQWLIDNADIPIEWAVISQYNRIIEAGIDENNNPGGLRTIPVRVSGTKWIPDIPAFEDVQQQIQGVISEPDVEKRALRMFLTVCRGQFFENGNKRTATMVANHILIHGGVGVFALDPSYKGRFAHMLTDYYETNDEDPLMQFLGRHAVEHTPTGLTQAELDKLADHKKS